MRYHLLFTILTACTPIPEKAVDSVDTEDAPVESAQDTHDSASDTESGETGDPGTYLPAISWNAVLSRRGATFTDILSVGEGSFLLGDPRYDRQSGAIWLLDGDTAV